MRYFMLAAAAATTLTFTAVPMSAHAVLFAALSNRTMCLGNSGGNAVLTSCGANSDSQINYVAGENIFYGPLRQNGQCLDVVNNAVKFQACNGSANQTWKYQTNGQLNNGGGYCVGASGSSAVVAKCPNNSWANETYARIQALANVPAGTSLAIKGNDVVNRNNPNQVVGAGAAAALKGAFPNAPIVAAGGGNIVAAGGGNIVAAGGGNIVAAGGGN